MLLHFVILITFVIMLPVGIQCELCDPISVPYTIGQNITLLDIPSEEVALLPAMCTKEIHIVDSVYSYIHVEEASFSGNEGFEYSNMGTVSKVYTDSASLTNRCSDRATGTEWTQPVVKGLTIYHNKDFICIRFDPELNHRSLGYHVQGGRVRITLQVKFAYCNRNNSGPVQTEMRRNRQGCRPICSSTGVESACVGSTKFNTLSTLPSLLLSSVSLTPTITAMVPSRGSLNTHQTSQGYNKAGFTSQKPSLTVTLSSARSWTTKHSSLNMTTTSRDKIQTSEHTGATRKTPETHGSNRNGSYIVGNFVPSESPFSINETLSRPSPSIKTGSLSVFPDNTTLDRNQSVKALETLPYVTTESIQNKGTTHDDTVHVPAVGNSAKTFGLLEGLYVLVGCLVVFVLAAAVTFCIRKTQKPKVSVSPVGSRLGNHMLSTSSYISQWRDNWLVRYHENKHHDGENSSIAESEIDIIHGQPVHESNHELQTIGVDTILNESSKENEAVADIVQYNDPWSVIRLDSDFVRKTKRLDSLSSDQTNDGSQVTMVKPVLKQNVSKSSSDSGIGRSDYNVDACFTLTKYKSTSLKEGSVSGKEGIRYIKRVNSHVWSRGSYNVSKAQRSVSLSSFDTDSHDINTSNYMTHKSRNDSSSRKDIPRNGMRRVNATIDLSKDSSNKL